MRGGCKFSFSSSTCICKALVQKEQVTDELGRVRQRFDDHVKESQTLIRAERDSARKENQALLDDLNEKVIIFEWFFF